ncbi:MAG: crotonase/enoyl-CoA hydratase family protein [Pseudonocardia sp.]|uniref:crotonase/enoyl-CoA hydratase family protein n=1 Tax=unclassified Pseudonocardia TaxID=2619320 RepID=UPI00086F8B81|nr:MULTISPECIES: crotonase/enoyl-CoA hydratase family protein [unclassified Pseudonocardia]MBN9109369.1 crotonase/enoyl-CoA hydratase family protein [Pseudonocardia sp.]ODU29493.1 MAG: enoyl-CoA hydratase [Pseudonocardia sp. SCN 72-51]ODV08082.1 MAG: enoyl-CoA hydratase [Pseudonocardia sp. SCN 73-27]
MTAVAPSSTLRVENADGIAVLTLDRPDRRNAVDLPTARLLGAALDAVDADPGIRVAILTGGPRFFSAGMDLKAFAQTGERPVLPDRGGFGIVGRPPTTPIIAAVEGAALGGGFEIALACDLIVAGEGASFGLPEVKRGLVASGGGLLRLPRRIPRNVATEAVLTGRPLSAARCAELGLVNAVVADGEALDAALALAGDIAANAPLALVASKQVMADSALWTDDEQFARQEAVVAPVRTSEDAREGARAFAEKRAPRWSGR